MWLAAIDAANVKGRIPAGFAWADFLADVQARKQ
jgi:hypothetical protein